MKRIYFLGLLIFIFLVNSENLKAGSPQKDSLAHFNVTLGIGMGMYLKDLPSVPNDDIHNLKPIVSAKFYWQPPFRVQLGLETGYYPFYTTTAIQFEGEPAVNSKSNVSVVPMMANVSVRVWKELKLAVGIGPALIFYDTEALDNSTSGTVFSAENYSLSASYLQPLTNHFAIGGELTLLYIGKTFDNQLSLKISAAYKF